MKPKHLLLMAIVGLAATSCQSGNSGSVVGSVSDESSVSSPVSTPVSDSTGSDVTSSGPSSDSTSASGPTSTSTSTSTPSSESASESTSEPPVPQRAVSDAINSAKTKGNLVKSGTIVTTSYPETTIDYEFGTDANGDFLHYHESSDWGVYDYYVVKDSSGKQINIEVEDGELSNPNDTFSLDGYVFNNIIDYSTEHLGVENLVDSLYTVASANANKDFVESSQEGTFSYSFGVGDSWSLRIITVTFTLSNNDVFATVLVEVDSYYSSSIIVDDDNGTVEVIPGSTPDSTATYTVAQVEGTRTATNPYNVEGFFFTAFDLTLDGAPVSDPIEVEASGWSGRVQLKLSNVAPATANAEFDEIVVEITSGNPEDIDVSYSSYNGTIDISGETTGNFTAKISTRDVEKTLNISMVPARAKSVSVVVMTQGINNSNGSEAYNSNTYIGSEPVTMYAGSEIILSVGITPSAVVDTIAFEVIGGEEANISVEDGTITQWGEPKDVIKVSSSVIGSYKIKVWPTNSPLINKEVDINVVAKPTLVEYITGSFATKRYNEINNEVVFTPTDATTGSVSITTSGGTEVASYVISESTQAGAYDVTLTHVSGASLEAAIKIGPDFSVVLYTGENDWGTTLTKNTGRFTYSGSYDTVIGDATYTLNLNANGEFSLSYNSNDGWGSVEGGWSLVERPEGGFFINFSASYYTEADQTMMDFADDTSYIDAEGNVHVNILVGGTSTPCDLRLIPAEELM